MLSGPHTWTRHCAKNVCLPESQKKEVVATGNVAHDVQFQLIIMAAVRSRCGHYIFALWFLLSFFFFFFPRLISAVAECLPYLYTWCCLSASLECRSEMLCTRLAGNTERKNDAKKSPSAHHRNNLLSGCIVATEACIDNRKNSLSSNMSSTCPYNMANFGG